MSNRFCYVVRHPAFSIAGRRGRVRGARRGCGPNNTFVAATLDEIAAAAHVVDGGRGVVARNLGAARHAGVGWVGAKAVAVAVEHRCRVVGSCWGSGGRWGDGGSCTRSKESLLDRGCDDGCGLESIAVEPCVAGREKSEAFAVGGVEVGDKVGVGLLGGGVLCHSWTARVNWPVRSSMRRAAAMGAITDWVFAGDCECAALVDVGPNRVDGVGGCPRVLQVEGIRLEFLVGDCSEASNELIHDGEDGDVGLLGGNG
jgi:hypothetical protein